MGVIAMFTSTTMVILCALYERDYNSRADRAFSARALTGLGAARIERHFDARA
jgi:hypothetical protein